MNIKCLIMILLIVLNEVYKTCMLKNTMFYVINSTRMINDVIQQYRHLSTSNYPSIILMQLHLYDIIVYAAILALAQYDAKYVVMQHLKFP